MRLIKQDIEAKTGAGTITLLPEEPEDMWHAHNLIAPNDLLRASAVRRVTTESATGSTSSTRVHTTLLIRVTNIEFDPQASQLHVSGRVAEENKWVKNGAYHTLDLELQRNFTIEKSEGWDSVALDVVREAVKQDKEGTVPAVVMQEGLANICLITEYQTVLKQRVESGIPKKRAGRSGDHDKGIERFYAIVLETLLRHVDITAPRPLLLASPGFTAQGFQKYILDEATRTGNKAVLGNKSNLVVVHSSSGHLHSLNEILQSQSVLSKLSNTKYAKETLLMDTFMTFLRKDDGRAWYGPNEVEKAAEKGAIGPGGTLLINNALFRAQDVGVRKRWVGLVDRVREGGGEVRILSSDHESGKRLEGLGGIAAILTFPLEDLDEDEEDLVGDDREMVI
ncbi:L30e-like protein [Glarea lozoyensis ATCC 20868]|uniref:Protein DOM34 homolog n=1 Tax=Glarea lozoyensis (strain ATCC 20868 / MF5171) TaxID=1116229 RepID=S3DFZ9_GLAL2|nr:L30e-like protein [Glarea lozoyensis ATCC 20868]EPE25563.1 L30e-like protein [Glarea lozoyensis ATCC 20868]